jgi:hypothetical protein
VAEWRLGAKYLIEETYPMDCFARLKGFVPCSLATSFYRRTHVRLPSLYGPSFCELQTCSLGAMNPLPNELLPVFKLFKELILRFRINNGFEHQNTLQHDYWFALVSTKPVVNRMVT